MSTKEPGKEVVTIRLGVETKARLHTLAGNEGRTVSSLIDVAVREFLDRRLGGETGKAFEDWRLSVRHASLPDTSVLRAFQSVGENQYSELIKKDGLPTLEFDNARTEWSRLRKDVLSGDVDLVESVNWRTLFLERKRGYLSPQVDWIAPFLQIFVGHCVFVRRDFAEAYFSNEDLVEFEKFRDEAKTGRDLSLRSMTAWVKHSQKEKNRGEKLATLWQDAIVCCQLETDFHIAIRRIAPLLQSIVGSPVRDPAIQGIDVLESGFQQFRNGTVTAFAGSLFHTAEMLADKNRDAFLIAGPADLRVHSLNTLAGRKGIFEGIHGHKILSLWSEAVTWFREEVIMKESEVLMSCYIQECFAEKAAVFKIKENESRNELTILKNLLQTWVKWFSDTDEANAFLGSNETINRADGLLENYEALCDSLRGGGAMPEVDSKEGADQVLWSFPVLNLRSNPLSKC